MEQCRKLITQHQFNDEPLRILIASLASGLRNTDAFITSTLQKHLFREMKLCDAAVKNPSTLKWNPLNQRYGPIDRNKSDEVEVDEDEEVEGKVEDNERPSSTSEKVAPAPPLPTKANPMIISIYGQICIAAKSYQSAICALVVCFSLSTVCQNVSCSNTSLSSARIRVLSQ